MILNRTIALSIGLFIVAIGFAPQAALAETLVEKEASQSAFEPVEKSELLKFLANPDSFTLLDARSPTEFLSGHVVGAHNVPHDQAADFDTTLPNDQSAPIVVYCRTGNRAALLATALQARGHTNVRVLAPTQMFWADGGLVVFNCASDTPGHSSASAYIE